VVIKNCRLNFDVELILKFEQLAAYSRVVAKDSSNGDYTEDEIRGIQWVKKNLLKKHTLISAALFYRLCNWQFSKVDMNHWTGNLL